MSCQPDVGGRGQPGARNPSQGVEEEAISSKRKEEKHGSPKSPNKRAQKALSSRHQHGHRHHVDEGQTSTREQRSVSAEVVRVAGSRKMCCSSSHLVVVEGNLELIRLGFQVSLVPLKWDCGLKTCPCIKIQKLKGSKGLGSYHVSKHDFHNKPGRFSARAGNHLYSSMSPET